MDEDKLSVYSNTRADGRKHNVQLGSTTQRSKRQRRQSRIVGHFNVDDGRKRHVRDANERRIALDPQST